MKKKRFSLSGTPVKQARKKRYAENTSSEKARRKERYRRHPTPVKKRRKEIYKKNPSPEKRMKRLSYETDLEQRQRKIRMMRTYKRRMKDKMPSYFTAQRRIQVALKVARGERRECTVIILTVFSLTL